MAFSLEAALRNLKTVRYRALDARTPMEQASALGDVIGALSTLTITLAEHIIEKEK